MVLNAGWVEVRVPAWHSWVMDLGVVAGILAGLVAVWALLLVVFWLLRPRGVALKELVTVVPDLLRLLRSLVGDGSVPLDVRVVLVVLAAWIVSPVDLIPEFIPVLGPVDDVVVAVVAMRYVRRRIGLVTLRDRWPGSPQGFALVARVIGPE
jgi:uncharacterized membrane protein YkvA (DUF1232 family)